MDSRLSLFSCRNLFRKDLAYKTVEKKDSTLYLGETRVEQEGKVGKERIFTAVNPSGSKEEKLREVVEAPTDRIVLVGTKPGTSLPEDEVKNLVLNRPELVIEEETIDFKVQERKSDKLYLGETRILQEGQKGIRIHLIEVENGKRTEKESYNKVMAQDRIVEVGTKPGTALPEDEVKNLVLNLPELISEEEAIDFKVQEQKNDKLPAGQTRVLQEGRQGIRVHLIEVENGKRTEKESYDKVMAQDRIVEVGTASETTKPVPQESTKPQVSEKADTKEIASNAASQAQEEQLPNTGSAESQAALAAGLALLGLSAGLVATKGKKED